MSWKSALFHFGSSIAWGTSNGAARRRWQEIPGGTDIWPRAVVTLMQGVKSQNTLNWKDHCPSAPCEELQLPWGLPSACSALGLAHHDRSCPSYALSSRSFSIFIALLWMLYSSIMSFSHYSTQACTQCSGWGCAVPRTHEDDTW